MVGILGDGANACKVAVKVPVHRVQYPGTVDRFTFERYNVSQPLIIGAISIAVIDTTVADLRTTTKNVPTFRIIIGGFVVVVALLAVSEYNEELADSFAILVLLATVFGPKAGGISSFLSKVLKADYVPPASLGTPIVQLPGYVDPNAKYHINQT